MGLSSVNLFLLIILSNLICSLLSKLLLLESAPLQAIIPYEIVVMSISIIVVMSFPVYRKLNEIFSFIVNVFHVLYHLMLLSKMMPKYFVLSILLIVVPCM